CQNPGLFSLNSTSDAARPATPICSWLNPAACKARSASSAFCSEEKYPTTVLWVVGFVSAILPFQFGIEGTEPGTALAQDSPYPAPQIPIDAALSTGVALWFRVPLMRLHRGLRKSSFGLVEKEETLKLLGSRKWRVSACAIMNSPDHNQAAGCPSFAGEPA